ncbi:MAG TPA: prolyl oligopeptidase family serine peptidase [Pirellulales bacterium]
MTVLQAVMNPLRLCAVALAILFCGCSKPAPAPKTDQQPASQAADKEAPAKSTEKANAAATIDPPRATKFAYPVAEKGDQQDDYHGHKIADPYRWLEDVDSAKTREWIAAENGLTANYLSNIPERPKIHHRLKKLWNHERYGIPSRHGGRYFYTKNDGLQNQSLQYVAHSLDAEPQLLLDPNRLAEDGTKAVLEDAISDDGKLFAYSIASGGSDWREWRIRNVDTKTDLDDRLKWIKFATVAWAPDGLGLYYSRYDEPNEATERTGVNYNQKLFYHKLGDAQSADTLIYERPDEKEWGFRAHCTDDGHYLVISVWRSTEHKNQLFYLDLQTPGAKVVTWITGFESEFEFIGNEGSTFYLKTDLDAPRNRIVAADVTQPGREGWKEIVKQQDDSLQGVTLVGGRLLALYLHDAHSRVQLYDLTGAEKGEIKFDELGTVALGTAKQSDEAIFYSFTSYLSPKSIYRYEIASGESTLFRKPDVDFSPDDYLTEQVFFQSKDGTRVPMFITRRKDLQKNGANPMYLYAYGGFNNSVTPTFSTANLVWLEMGGVYAVANLRGGGEYGREWHEAGMLDKKQNVFDDFLGAAQWLIDQGYTSSKRLAISGRSNGGLLVGAALTQRPDLFGAALPAVGVMDMLRFHKFTIGWAWVSEYGSSDSAAQFPALLAYSPLHNIKPGTAYPATLITTADHDDRVVPGHSFKFAATLQAAQAGPAPVLIRIESSAGHGAGTPTAKLIEENADSYAFLVKALGVELPKTFGEKISKSDAAGN